MFRLHLLSCNLNQLVRVLVSRAPENKLVPSLTWHHFKYLNITSQSSLLPDKHSQFFIEHDFQTPYHFGCPPLNMFQLVSILSELRCPELDTLLQTSSNTQCSLSSEDIERRFRMNPQGSISFTTTKFNYILNFPEMKQTNQTTGKERPIKRAPFSISAFSYICENQSIPMPSHWENVNSEEPYQLIPLQKQTNEYNEVASYFGKTMDSNRIKRIQRIQNIDLWEFYCRKKAQLKKKRGISFINEHMLFHGTSTEFVEAICIHNFDWRINGMHAAVYGKGTYFARDASYSSRFCKEDMKHGDTFQIHGVDLQLRILPKHKAMFLVRVLTGDYITGDSKYVRPPSKDGSFVNLYDSCVDSTWNPKIFVIFDANQTYPEYLIEFS